MSERSQHPWVGALLWLATVAGSWAIETPEVELGLNGVYDSTVGITRDAAGRMTFRDNEVTSPVALDHLRLTSDHGGLPGLEDDDHPQYLHRVKGGDIAGSVTIRNVLTVSSATVFNGTPYDWPAAQGDADRFLSNDGSGGLSWSRPGGGITTASADARFVNTDGDAMTGALSVVGLTDAVLGGTQAAVEGDGGAGSLTGVYGRARGVGVKGESWEDWSVEGTGYFGVKGASSYGHVGVLGMTTGTTSAAVFGWGPTCAVWGYVDGASGTMESGAGLFRGAGDVPALRTSGTLILDGVAYDWPNAAPSDTTRTLRCDTSGTLTWGTVSTAGGSGITTDSADARYVRKNSATTQTMTGPLAVESNVTIGGGDLCVRDVASSETLRPNSTESGAWDTGGSGLAATDFDGEVTTAMSAGEIANLSDEASGYAEESVSTSMRYPAQRFRFKPTMTLDDITTLRVTANGFGVRGSLYLYELFVKTDSGWPSSPNQTHNQNSEQSLTETISGGDVEDCLDANGYIWVGARTTAASSMKSANIRTAYLKVDVFGSGGGRVEASGFTTDGRDGLDETVILTDENGTTHTLIFSGGLLTAHTTNP